MSLYAIVFISVLNQIAFSASRVAVSLHALELGASQVAVGVIVACYSLCPILLSIAIGRIADRAAPRPPILIGCSAMAASLLLPLFFPGLGALYVLGLLLGLFHTVFNIPLEAIIGGVGGKGKRASNYAIVTMGWSAANTVGPLVAGIAIDYLDHVRVFWVLAAIGAVPFFFLLVVRGVIPPGPTHMGEPVRRSVFDLLRMRQLRITIVASGIVSSALDLFQFYMPVYGHAIGLPASAIGIIVGMLAAAAFVIRGVLPYLARRYSEPQIVIFAAFVAAAAFALMPLFSDPYALAAVSFLLGLGVGTFAPMTLSLLYAVTPDGRIAEALGVHKTLRNATQLAVPIVFGSMGAAFGYAAVFLSNSAILAWSAFFLRRAGLPTSAELRRE